MRRMLMLLLLILLAWYLFRRIEAESQHTDAEAPTPASPAVSRPPSPPAPPDAPIEPEPQPRPTSIEVDAAPPRIDPSLPPPTATLAEHARRAPAPQPRTVLLGLEEGLSALDDFACPPAAEGIDGLITAWDAASTLAQVSLTALDAIGYDARPPWDERTDLLLQRGAHRMLAPLARCATHFADPAAAWRSLRGELESQYEGHLWLSLTDPWDPSLTLP